jgi:hypothetical protein
MKTQISLAIGLAGSLLATSAFAQEGAAAPAPKLSAGAQIDLLPIGSYDVKVGEFESDGDLAFAYGIGASIDYAVTPMISVGFAPRYIMNVKDTDSDGDAASELDLRLRVKASFPVSPGMAAYGFVTPGYSIIMAPEDAGDVDDPAGFAIGFGGGATYDVSPSLFVNGELGYQLGFQKSDAFEFQTAYLHIGFGAGTRF